MIKFDEEEKVGLAPEIEEESLLSDSIHLDDSDSHELLDMIAEDLEVDSAHLFSKEDEAQLGFYRTINPNDEFGISRFVADRTYHLPKLLSKPELVHQEGTTSYIIQAQINDSYGNNIKLEHRLQALSDEEANKIAHLVIKRLQGIQHKIWMATWKLANKLESLTYTCELTQLMKLTYPNRETYFQTKEKIEFYEHLRSLENTKFVFTKKIIKNTKSKKEEHKSYEIRLLEINTKVGEQEEYPREITLTILNPAAFKNENTVFLGAAVKNATLELHADDLMLASVIQFRKSQRPKAKVQKWARVDLIHVSGLTASSLKNKTQANKLLLVKLKRLEEKGILEETPQRILDFVTLKVR